MSEWNELTIGELPLTIGDGNYSSKYPTAKEFKAAGIPFISNKDIKNGRIISGSLRYIAPEKHAELKKGHIKEHDILVSTRANIGDIAYVDASFEDANINAQLVFLRCDEKTLHSKFIYQLLSSKHYHAIFQNHASGSAQMQLPIAALRKISSTFPEFDEQRAIAAVLSSLDDKIDLLHRQNQTLEAIAATLFRQWFVEEAQVDWEEGVISDLVEFNPQRKLAKGTIAPYLEMASLSTSTFNPESWYDREFSSGTKFMNEDTLLARITPCLENGKTAYVTILDKDQVGWGSTEYIVMRPKGCLHPFFAYVLARNSDFRDFAEGCLAGSSGRQRVETNHLMSYKIKIPADGIVKKFNAVAESIAPKLHSNAVQIRTLETLRDTLLPKLMSGEVRVAV